MIDRFFEDPGSQLSAEQLVPLRRGQIGPGRRWGRAAVGVGLAKGAGGGFEQDLRIFMASFLISSVLFSPVIGCLKWKGKIFPDGYL